MSDPRRYELFSVLGQGGFGTVYRARLLGQGGFTKQVALKFSHQDSQADEDLADKLREEARLLGLVRHRAIVHVDNLLLLNGTWTVVMEYIDGVDLRTALRSGPLPVRSCLEVVEEIAGAMHVAWSTRDPGGHELCLVHRDIKPSNVLLTAAGEVKLLDFGIARAHVERREEPTTVGNAGSRAYMPPERHDGIDHPRSDVYSLGAVLFELLTGRAVGVTSATPTRHARRHTLAIATLAAELEEQGEAVANLVGQMLHFDPESRPSAREVERRCTVLQSRLEGAPLRDWAEEQIPQLVIGHVPTAESVLDGPVVLVEQTESEARECQPIHLADEIPLQVRRNPTDRNTPRRDFRGKTIEVEDALTRPYFEASVGEDTNTEMMVSDEVMLYRPRPEVSESINTLQVVDGVTPPKPGKAKPPGLAFFGSALLAAPVIGILIGLFAVGSAEIMKTAPSDAVISAVSVELPPEDRAVETLTVAVGDTAAYAVQTALEDPLVQAPPDEPVALAPVAPAPRPRGADVSLAGDPADVVLVSDDRRVALPDRAPPGTYVIEATFPGGSPVVAGRLALVAGDRTTLTCSALFARCTAR